MIRTGMQNTFTLSLTHIRHLKHYALLTSLCLSSYYFLFLIIKVKNKSLIRDKRVGIDFLLFVFHPVPDTLKV